VHFRSQGVEPGCRELLVARRDWGGGLLPPHQLLKGSQNLVQQSLELGQQGAQRASAIQQVGNGTQQVAQKIASTRDRGDIEHDLIQVDYKPKDVEVEWAQYKIDEAATGIRTHHRQGYVLSNLSRSSVPGDDAIQYALSYELVSLNREIRDVDQAVNVLPAPSLHCT
jgi:hypothetical protein